MNPNEEHSRRVSSTGDSFRDRVAVLVNSSFYGRGRDVLICMIDYQDNIVGLAKPIEMEMRPAAEIANLPIQPTLSGPVGSEFLQSALDAAWEAGMRPKNWRIETTEQVAAMNSHLQDMRAIVFGQTVTIPPFVAKPGGIDRG